MVAGLCILTLRRRVGGIVAFFFNKQLKIFRSCLEPPSYAGLIYITLPPSTYGENQNMTDWLKIRVRQTDDA